MELNGNQAWNNGEDWLLCMTHLQLEQVLEDLEQRHRERTRDQLPKDIRLAILLSMCPTDLEKELTAQQHMCPDYAQMRAHIVTVNSRTRGPAPMMMGNLNDEASNNDVSSDELVEGEDGELYRLEIRNGKKVFLPNAGMIRPKATPKVDEKAEPTKNVFAVGVLVIVEQVVEERPPKSAPKGKGVGSCEEEERETLQNVRLGTIDLGSFEVLSDHGDTVEDDVVVDESSEESAGTTPPLPPAPRFNKTRTSKHTEMHRGRFSKHCHDNDCRDSEGSSFFDCWDEQSDIMQ